MGLGGGGGAGPTIETEVRKKKKIVVLLSGVAAPGAPLRAAATLRLLLICSEFVCFNNIIYNDHDNAKKIHRNPSQVSQP